MTHDELKEVLFALEKQNREYRAAIEWALGENGDFRTQEDGEGKYYWRKELRKRARL